MTYWVDMGGWLAGVGDPTRQERYVAVLRMGWNGYLEVLDQGIGVQCLDTHDAEDD